MLSSLKFHDGACLLKFIFLALGRTEKGKVVSMLN
jgi:hypothetical protein